MVRRALNGAASVRSLLKCPQHDRKVAVVCFPGEVHVRVRQIRRHDARLVFDDPCSR